MEKIKFDTKYTRNTASGQFDLDENIYSKYQYGKHIEVDKVTGCNRFVIDEEPVNVFENIQAYTDGCSLDSLLERYKKTGDISVIQRKQGQFFDASVMPDSLIGMYKTLQDGQRYFDSLPVDVKNKFNNSFTEFIAKGGVIDDVSDVVNDDSVPGVADSDNVKVGDENANK